MEQFEINLVGELLTVSRNDDESLTIHKGETKLGVIWPELEDSGIIWRSEDLTRDLAMQIGELIEEHDL